MNVVAPGHISDVHVWKQSYPNHVVDQGWIWSEAGAIFGLKDKQHVQML